jgi:hypothetical protein
VLCLASYIKLARLSKFNIQIFYIKYQVLFSKFCIASFIKHRRRRLYLHLKTCQPQIYNSLSTNDSAASISQVSNEIIAVLCLLI